jgi:hypothetical protein
MEAPRDHEVQDEPQIVFQSDADAFAHAPQFFDSPAFGCLDWGHSGPQ